TPRCELKRAMKILRDEVRALVAMLGEADVEPGNQARFLEAVMNAGRDEDDVADLHLALDAAAVFAVDLFPARHERAAALLNDPYVDGVLVELRAVGARRGILDVPDVDVVEPALEHADDADLLLAHLLEIRL